jgi:hypothetical protein
MKLNKKYTRKFCRTNCRALGILGALFSFIIKEGFSAPLVCTVCSVGIASGLGIAKLFGVSDNIIAIWLGGVLLAMSSGFLFWLEKKKINNRLLKIIAFFSSYIFLIFPYIGKEPSIIFNQNKTLFIDSFIFFTLVGSLAVFLCEKYYINMKNKRGKPHFQFEKVILPIGLLIILSLIINFL